MNNITGQKSLEILQQRMEQKVAQGQAHSKATLDVIERDGQLLNDFICTLGEKSAVSFKGNGGTSMVVTDKGKVEEFSIHPWAGYQLGEKLVGNAGVATYLRDSIASKEEWQRVLAAEVLNEHAIHGKRTRVLVRAVGDQVRGVLSDQYRRMNSGLIYQSAIKAANAEGAMVIDAHYDDTRGWIEFMRPEIVSVPTEMNEMLHLSFGARISTSDFGDGALEIRAFWMQVRCLNGAVGESLMREVHLGGRLPDNLQMSEKTYRLDTETMASATHDIFKNILALPNIKTRAQQFQKAANTPVEFEAEVKRLRKAAKLSVGESEGIVKVLTNNNPDDGMAGGNSLWKLSQAVGAVARTADPRRKRDLEQLAGELLSSVK